MSQWASHPTGFPNAPPQGFQIPQQTGFAGPPGVAGGFLQMQPTGYPGAQSAFGQQQRPPPPPVPPLPSQYQQNAPPPPPPVPQQQQQTGFLHPNQNRFFGVPPGSFGGPGLGAQPTGIGLVPQPTGFAGRAPAPLVPQATGFVDPRLQMMSSVFLPANTSAPYTAGGAPQLAPSPQQQLGGMSLQQSIQQYNQTQGRGAAPKIPWVLSRGEKKNYDQIFRAWDNGTGFISGQTALEVFGQSALDRNDLAKIWTLADADNRGKLNLAEFHVAMGLIYRKLQGNEIPDVLPPELVPPSSRDLDTSVNFLKDILKNDARARSPSALDTPVSRLKERSLNSPSSSLTTQGGRQDATVYKHEDVEPPGGFYQSRNRHVDRDTVRSRADDASPASDLTAIKNQLLNTQRMLDDTLSTERASDALDRDLEDLRYRIRRLQEDLEYVSRGPKSNSRDMERRRLERELVRLMHEEVPELERKVEEREAKREREKRDWARERDRRNDRFGRFGDDDSGRYSPSSRYRDGEDRPYSRGPSRYERDERDHDRERAYQDDRSADRDRDRGLPPTTRSPPPAPAPSSLGRQSPAPPAPSRSPAPSAAKNMSPEERQAFIRAEAKRRLEARMQALGVSTPSSGSNASPTLDTTVEDRLAQEKKEAEEKAREAERQAEERERVRKEKLEAEKALKEGKSTPTPTPTTTAPAPAPARAPAAAPVPTPKPTPTSSSPRAAPPPPKSRAPAPPPPRKGGVSRAPLSAAPAPAPAPVPASRPAPPPAVPALARSPISVPQPVAAAEPDEDPEDAALRAREEALRKKREERAALLRKLEEEEEEARKAEEEYQARRNHFLTAKAASPPVKAAPVIPPVSAQPAVPVSLPPAPAPVPAPTPAVVEEPVEEAVPPSPPPPPPAPPAPPAVAPAAEKSSNNPFSRMMKDGATGVSSTPTTPGVTTSGSSNPFFRPQTTPPAPAPPKSPGIPAPVKTTYHTAPKDSDDDWDDIMEKEEDDSSDEEVSTRDTRMGLAQQLFGNLLPSRPQSAGPPVRSAGSPTQAAPPAAPPAPPAPAPAPPPPPAAPPAPPAPAAPSSDRNALLSAIQAGSRLRKAVTNDRSAVATSGRVLGESAPPAHIHDNPQVISPPSPPPAVVSSSPVPFGIPPAPAEPLAAHTPPSGHVKKESVDWYRGLAADVDRKEVAYMPATVEEEEEEHADSDIPAIQVSEHAEEGESDLMVDVDRSIEYRVRSLYPYDGQRTEDLSFAENIIIIAHPSKTGGDWWYGTSVKERKSGFFPQTYVQKVEQVHARALYDYSGASADELSFAEGDDLSIVDRSEADWWKAERDGSVFIVPAAYLEVAEDRGDLEGRSRLEGGQALGIDTFLHGDADREISTDVYSTPNASPQNTRKLQAPELHVTNEDEEDADEEEDEDDYYSLEDDDDGVSDTEEEETETPADREAREMERKLVLEAAGLIVNTVPSHSDGDDATLSVVARPSASSLDVDVDSGRSYASESSSGSRMDELAGTDVRLPSLIGATPEMAARKRRPAPMAPQRTSLHHSSKDLPPVPLLDLPDTDTQDTSNTTSLNAEEPMDKHTARRQLGHIKTSSEASNNIVPIDDAFERYETYKKMHGSHATHHPHPHSFVPVPGGPPSANRLSVSSFDTTSPVLSSPPRSPAASVTHSLREREQGGESRTSHFLSFLGRHNRSVTPDHERERKLHIISGPILHTPVPSSAGGGPSIGDGESFGPTREGSPAFGSSWASLVDRTALDGIPKAERKRQEAIFELIATEADYVRDLQLIVELFYSRLIDTLDEKAASVIFANIEDILLTNTTFLSTLEERQRDCRLYVDRIGDLLEKHMPNMRVYLNYCVNQANAAKALQSMRENNPELAAQLQRLREDPSARNLDLSSYLLVPMQRLTRYPLLIRQILQYTDPGSPAPPSISSSKIDSTTPLSPPSPSPSHSSSRFSFMSPPNHASTSTTTGRVSPVPPQLTLSFSGDILERQSILASLQIAEKILEEVNETIRDQEGLVRLGEVSKELWVGNGRLDLTAPTRHLGPRKLLKEGVLCKAKSGRKLRLLLCSDILVLLDEVGKGLYRVPIPVNEIQVKPSRSGRDDSLIRVHLSYPRGGDTIILRASNVREAKAWSESITDASRKAKEGIMNMIGTGGNGVGAY